MFLDRQAKPILGAIVACTVPHFVSFSWWVTFVCLCLWGYAALAAKYTWRLPGRLVSRLLAGVFLVGAMSTHEGFTLEAFLALLALMAALKLFEIRQQRDRMITVILCYFLIAGLFPFGDSIGMTAYMLFSILVTTAALIHINQPARATRTSLRFSGLLVAQALPIMLIFFLLFPRFHGGIWGRSLPSSAQTGFSDRIEFGDVANLARNAQVAFRVEFEGPIPPPAHLYWRAVVLTDFDGRVWRRGRGSRGWLLTPREAPRGIGYTVTLEPHSQRWLPTLDLPLWISYPKVHLQQDYTCYGWRPITNREAYRAVSDPETRSSQPERFQKDALQLPRSGNPRSRALAAALSKEAGNDEEYVQRVLTHFRNQPYTYTLQPPPSGAGAGENPIDHFLFDSRQGFCEHFACSLVFLMRAAGVPARVVAGYQGGERNPYGGYLTVRQYDAHAWCEVWLPEKGWLRVDPTSVVAPARLRGNVGGALPAEDAAGFLSFMRSGTLGQWLREVGTLWDFFNNRWNQWVMNYSANQQEGFLTKFGLDLKNSRELAATLSMILGGVVLMLILLCAVLFRPPKPDHDPIAAAWGVFCRKMGRIGLPRPPGQGPLDYLEWVNRQRPDLAPGAAEIVTAYVRLRYGGRSGMKEIVKLRSRVKRFVPRSASFTTRKV